MDSRHAQTRAQQRAIPPFVDRLLDEFGVEVHDGHGAIRVFFDHTSVRAMEKQLGKQPVALFRRYLPIVRVDSCRDGKVITRYWRTRPIKRP